MKLRMPHCELKWEIPVKGIALEPKDKMYLKRYRQREQKSLV